jgi:disulfide bond formation protein DsbB
VSTDTLSRFFASLALFTFAATVVVIALVIAGRMRPDSGAAAFVDDVAANSLWLGMIVAAVTTAGSLYYSLGAHFTPCELCWYQRICVYPLSVVLLIAALRRDFGVWRYGLPPALVGIVIAAYHSQLQAFPTQATFCSLTNPCTIRYVWQFGFVSLPLMDLAALIFITAMLLLARAHERQIDSAFAIEVTPT